MLKLNDFQKLSCTIISSIVGKSGDTFGLERGGIGKPNRNPCEFQGRRACLISSSLVGPIQTIMILYKPVHFALIFCCYCNLMFS
jgi:hypothetical protein